MGLRQSGQTLRTSLQRETDFIARYGGEEFVVVLPGSDRASGLLMADDLRIALEALRIDHVKSSADPYLTITVGGVTLRPDAAGRLSKRQAVERVSCGHGFSTAPR